VNAAQGDGMTPLHWAATNGDADLAGMLLAAGANVRATTRVGGYTPLLIASKNGNAGVVEALLAAAPNTRFLRDPTRGGVATVCNELARAAEVSVVIQESAVPVRNIVNGACEILGIDPLYVANEGKLLAVVPAEEADAALAAMRGHPVGADAAIIGEIRDEPPGIVIINTFFGGNRIVDMLVGDPLPRIC
jgi:hydrogenase expression/formation protein HypE